MPIQGLVDYKKPHHRRDDSGDELDVFEAARYYNDNFSLSQKVIKEERQGYLRGGRVSLDMPTLKHHHHLLHQYNNHPIPQPYPQKQQGKHQQQQQQIKDKKHKQPSSPGGKLAHFLNLLFNQTSSKKKKSSSKSLSTTLSMKDEDESPSGRRKRRSSISHFRSTSSATDAKSIYSSSSSGFRTPPPYNLNTPIKCYKDFKSFSDHKQVLANLSKYSINNDQNGVSSKPRIIGRGNDERSEKGSNLDRVDEKIKFRNGFLEKEKPKDFNHAHQEKKKREIIKNLIKEEVDDGGESDSSSDLFELQIDYGFGFCSSGLPVYETTHMDSIKRSSNTAITNGPIKN